MLKAHMAYLRYLLRHKWYVLKGCRMTSTPLWRGLVHDVSKFLPSEWGPYVRTFYNPDGSKRYQVTPEFEYAWQAHQRRNLHHWQAWLVTWDKGGTEPLEMPEVYVREMVADWIGAGLAITGKLEPRTWYEKNRGNIQLHPRTRVSVEALLERVEPSGRCLDRDPVFGCPCVRATGHQGDHKDNRGNGWLNECRNKDT